jgi:hypothetical protein
VWTWLGARATIIFIVDQKQAQYIDCNNIVLPFGSQFVSDIVNRTHMAQDQEQALLATELVLKAQKNPASDAVMTRS